MAAGDWTPYAPALEALGNKDIDLAADIFKMLLLDSTHTPDTTNHDQLSDISADEMSGNGYARATVSPAWTRTGATSKFSAGGATIFTADGGDLSGIKYAVIYDDTHADDMPICILDLNDGGGAIADVLDGTALRVNVPAGGFFTVAAT